MGAFLMKRYHDRYLGCYLVLAGALALAGSIFTMDYYIISCGAFSKELVKEIEGKTMDCQVMVT